MIKIPPTIRSYFFGSFPWLTGYTLNLNQWKCLRFSENSLNFSQYIAPLEKSGSVWTEIQWIFTESQRLSLLEIENLVSCSHVWKQHLASLISRKRFQKEMLTRLIDSGVRAFAAPEAFYISRAPGAAKRPRLLLFLVCSDRNFKVWIPSFIPKWVSRRTSISEARGIKSNS